MHERSGKLRICSGIIGILLAIFMTVVIFDIFSYETQENDQNLLQQGWTVTVRDEVTEDADLYQLFFPVTNLGDTVVMERQLPDAGVERPVLRFLTIHSVVEVLLNDEVIYTYGEERAEQGQMVGYGYHFVELPADYAGKMLTIRQEVTEEDAFTSLAVPVICEGNTAVTELLVQYRVPLVLSVFLVVFGLSLLFVTAVVSIFSSRVNRLIWVALFSCFIGIWNLCSYHLLQLFTPSLALCTLLEFVSIYVAPLMLLLYFREDMEGTGVKLIQYPYRIIVCFHGMFCVAALLLHGLGILHLPRGLKINQFSCVVMILFVLLVQIYRARKKKPADKVVLAGMIVVIGFAVIDLIRFNLQKYISSFQRVTFNGFMAVGVLILILILFAGFYMEIIGSLYKEARQKLLEKQAYTDALTSVANRRRCEEEMERLTCLGPTEEFSILNLDLNELKRANDVYGHEEGDYLISTFAHVLDEVFSPVGLVGRMGGDEFMVLMRNMDREACAPYIQRMKDRLEELNAAGGHPELSTSYGFASSAECTAHDAHEVYRLADNRMYAYKKEYKARRREN